MLNYDIDLKSGFKDFQKGCIMAAYGPIRFDKNLPGVPFSPAERSWSWCFWARDLEQKPCKNPRRSRFGWNSIHWPLDVGLLDRWMDGCLAMMILSSILQRHQSLVGQLFNLILGEDQLPVLSIDPLIHGLPEVQGRVPWKCSPMTMSLEDPVDNCVPGCLVGWMNMV